MSDRVAFPGGRAWPRLALTGLALVWLSGCSSDITRFASSGSPFSNPFSGGQTADASPAPSPVASAAPAGAGHAGSAPQPVGGSAVGWTAVGGSPIVVAQGETLDSLSGRYGVPSAALLSANGLSSSAAVRGGMRIVVPVYHANGGAVAAAAAPAGKKVAEAAAKPAKKHAHDVAARDGKDSAKTSSKIKRQMAAAASTPAGKAAPAKSAPAVVAKADPGKPGQAKKSAVDATPTGKVETGGTETKAPLTGAQADASGLAPEFRWPARGRIIQGFKAGGNDGINISVPAGTSVRAAENGVVVYSGDGLKGYGNLVLIKHPNGFVTAYANNAELDVKRGETVKRGQIIAKSGDTGNVNAPQLHFELRKGSTPVDPTNYLAGL